MLFASKKIILGYRLTFFTQIDLPANCTTYNRLCYVVKADAVCMLVTFGQFVSGPLVNFSVFWEDPIVEVAALNITERWRVHVAGLERRKSFNDVGKFARGRPALRFAGIKVERRLCRDIVGISVFSKEIE